MAERTEYRQIADALREAILRREYRPGDALPREEDLAERFHVTRPTIRQAIRVLRQEGRITTRRGQGTFVRVGPTVALRYRPDMPRGGPWSTSIATIGPSGSVHPIGVEVIPAGGREMSWLEIAEGVDVMVRRRHIRDANGDPIQLYDSYFALDLVRDTPLGDPTTAQGGVYRTLERMGHLPVEFGESVGARMPTPNEAAVLRLGDRTPVLEIVRVTRDDSGLAVEALHIVAAADRNLLVYDALPIARGKY